MMALMLMLDGGTRYLLELVRVEPPVIGHMSLGMVEGPIILIAGTILWFVFSERLTPARAGPGRGLNIRRSRQPVPTR